MRKIKMHIYELVKERITDFKEIFVINPRHTTGAKESGRAKLTELFARFSQEDAVIWDNFPDDIIQTDHDRAKTVLEELSSKNMKTLFVAFSYRIWAGFWYSAGCSISTIERQTIYI